MSCLAIDDIKAVRIAEKEIILPPCKGRDFKIVQSKITTPPLTPKACFQTVQCFDLRLAWNLILLRRIKINSLRRTRASSGTGKKCGSIKVIGEANFGSQGEIIIGPICRANKTAGYASIREVIIVIMCIFTPSLDSKGSTVREVEIFGRKSGKDNRFNFIVK